MAKWTEPENLDDPLSGLLERLCLPGWTSGVAWMSKDWQIDAPSELATFYLLQRGQLRLLLPGHPPVECTAGDLLLLPKGASHRLANGRPLEALSLFDLHRRRLPADDVHTDTVLIFGYCDVSQTGRDILLDGLPRIVHLHEETDPRAASHEALAALVVEEATLRRPGWQIGVSRAVQLLLLHAIRAQLTKASPWQSHGQANEARYLRALNDPHLGPAMRMMHEDPGRAWTVPQLARQAGISKSAFSERFRQAVGQPPLQYLTEYRMHKACELLRGSKVGIKQISGLVGYESASSFTNTFKRWIGCTPAEYRKTGREVSR